VPVPESAPAAPIDAATPSEAELRRIVLRLTRAQIAYFGPDGRVLFATPALSQALGLPLDEIIGRTVEEMGISPTRSRWMRELGVRAAAERQPMLEIVDFAEDGVSVDRQVAMEPDVAPDGTVKGFVVTAWDITELRQAARRIAQLDRVYALLSEIDQAIVRIRDRDALLAEACRIAAEVGVFELCWIGLLEPNGDVRKAARAGSDVSVLDEAVVSARDEPAGRGAVGASIRENRTVVVDDAAGDERMAPWHVRLVGHGFRTTAAFPLRLGGRPIGAFALYSSQPGYFDAEEVRLFEELAGDISFALDRFEAERERGVAQEALRESERRFRDLFDSNPIPMWVFDFETLRFGAVNDAAVATYGYSREEFLRMTLSDIRPPEDVAAMLASVAAPGEGYRPSDVWRHRRKDGALLDVEVSGHDIEFEGRKARVIAAIDVTERRRLEAQLAEARRMEAMGHLAGGIAHDFNNLLTAILGNAELLGAELGDSPMVEEAREIQRAGARAAELTRQVLAFASRQVMAPRPVDLNEVVAGAGQMLRRLIGEQIKLVLKPEREPAVVMADPGQLEQVLVNLVINARDAMPEGGTLQIGVKQVAEAAELGAGSLSGRAVLLTVADTGIGMDTETLAHAFEPFFTTKQAGAGTGLGLATVYGIVRQFKGEIWAESAAGAGTTVSVLLRRVEARPEPLARLVPVVSGSVAAATILVVEDEPAVRALVVSTLERAGYRVMVAASPAEAVALNEGLDAPIDLLLTDLIMPGGNGQALAERLLQKRPAMRVMMMSGYGAGLGPIPPDAAFHFIAKPFGRDELTAAVALILAEA
jgi:PAS domain S-box-containing protein